MIVSVCIPKIEKAIESVYIQNQWKKTNIGQIKQYTELAWKNDPLHKRILMRIEWNDLHPQSAIYHSMLESGKHINIVYDFPKIWKLFLAIN